MRDCRIGKLSQEGHCRQLFLAARPRSENVLPRDHDDRPWLRRRHAPDGSILAGILFDRGRGAVDNPARLVSPDRDFMHWR